jgi:hypothetical protein
MGDEAWVGAASLAPWGGKGAAEAVLQAHPNVRRSSAEARGRKEEGAVGMAVLDEGRTAGARPAFSDEFG